MKLLTDGRERETSRFLQVK